MHVERLPPTASPIEVLDRVLAKGIRIEAVESSSPVGLGLFSVEARVLVVTAETHEGFAVDHPDVGVTTPLFGPSEPEPIRDRPAAAA